MRRFAAVIAALALVALVAAPVAAAPGIKFTTHLTEDGTTVAGLGTVASPFVITTSGVAGVMHDIQLTGVKSSPPLLKTNDSFSLVSDAAQRQTLTNYFLAKGWPNPDFYTQINAEIAGAAPFFDLVVGAGSGWFLGDGFHAGLSAYFPPGMYGLQIDDDYPVGTYTYTGILNGQNHTHIPFTFVMTVVRV